MRWQVMGSPRRHSAPLGFPRAGRARSLRRAVEVEADVGRAFSCVPRHDHEHVLGIGSNGVAS